MYRHFKDIGYAQGSELVDQPMKMIEFGIEQNPHTSDPATLFTPIVDAMESFSDLDCRKALVAALIRLVNAKS